VRKIRVIDTNYIDPYYLFYLLNSKIIRKQIDSKTFVQATISTIGNRLREVVLPIFKDKSISKKISLEVKDIIEQQVAMVNEYKGAWSLFRQDKNFTPEELDYMLNIYMGMMDESMKNIDQLFLVVNAYATQMTDAKRLEIINTVADNIQTQYFDLKEFNTQNKMLSLQRASELSEIEYVRKLYGLGK
ncbi:MAG TPA: hypothetical protein PKM40_00360, partial [Bacteroidia bacterium]|nr:hypothetical protein [Bacteroidia bacterium]